MKWTFCRIKNGRYFKQEPNVYFHVQFSFLILAAVSLLDIKIELMTQEMAFIWISFGWC